ncbi:MAG TPA: tRNA uridine-5-carboxymethylaminomethyl(34) synthesis GTPase MnmE [Candidatus Limnocylindrales bacterium]|nr:tRNA uridine-5-carboxymethylaminomethyl(34) synthesis GTPase MnmE [Candidatus Limnocylindrales bacterium]
MFFQEDTIAAISTPLGEGGIGVIRISGKAAIAIADALFVSPSKGKKLKDLPSHTVHYGHIYDPGTQEPVDEVLVTLMRAPKSYTREDVVEISSHGGFISLKRILDLVLKGGARLAEPGEFTKRAFLNGRIDLSQAEAVIDIIQSRTELSHKVAVRQLEGRLSQKVRAIRDTLKHLTALVEASIDFSEEDIEVISPEALDSGIGEALESIDFLIETAEEGQILREGLSLVIVGKPNVGKSSLLNVLLEEERAIVTPIPGTTRDVIEESLNLKGVPVRLLDTAGIRNTEDPVEVQGVLRSKNLLEKADLVLWVLDSSSPLTQEDRDILELVKEKKVLGVLNKIDLPSKIGEEAGQLLAGIPWVKISAKEKSGIETLKDLIFEMVVKTPVESVWVTNIRHKNALIKAQQSLLKARESIAQRMSGEFIAVDLRAALDSLGEIIGETTTEDILTEIFSTFCIGK